MMPALLQTMAAAFATACGSMTGRAAHTARAVRIPSFRWCAAALFIIISTAGQSTYAAVPAGPGAWQNGPNLPFFPVHLHLMANNKVMMWPGDGGVSGDDPRVWDPATGTVN